MDVRLVIFDLDDTLYPEIQFVYSGYFAVSRYVAKKYGLNAGYVFDFLVSAFERGNTKNTFDLLVSKFGIDENVETLVTVYRTHRPSISLYPDAEYILKYLRKRKIATALITDGYLYTQLNKIRALGITNYFDKVLVNDISRGRSKRERDPFLKILSDLGVEPTYTIYVGDNPEKDFLAPGELGIRTVRIVRREGIYRELSDNKVCSSPDFVIYDLRSLLRFV